MASAWGEYVEYVLNDQYMIIFKDFNRSDENLAEVDSLLETLKSNKYLGFAMSQDGEEEPEEILNENVEIEKEEEKNDSLYARFKAMKEAKKPKR